jgi:hypothetical protein
MKTRKLTFSNTQCLGSHEQNLIDKSMDTTTSHILSKIPHRPYPSDANREIESIKKIQNKYKSSRQEDIKKECDGEYIISKFTTSTTERLSIITLLNTYVDPIIFNLKVKYDRVRPSIYDSSVDTTIEIPSHPSYPSGHATQSYFIGYYLSKLHPENKHKYMDIAESIAVNREIAGVHYPSDSDYGKLIAKTVMDNV